VIGDGKDTFTEQRRSRF